MKFLESLAGLAIFAVVSFWLGMFYIFMHFVIKFW